MPSKSTNPLFISGSAVASAKPLRSFKGGNPRKAETGPSSLKIQNYFPPNKEGNKHATNNEDHLDDQDEQGGDGTLQPDGSLRPEGFFLIKPALPDDPRKAAVMLAARQKNHRPLPDVNVESRDALIPRNWNGGMQPSAVTVDTTKAKGPTACTKRHVVRLTPESQPIERRPNVMELAIKWEAKTPPSSAGKAVRAKPPPPPVEKTLHWLYENPAIEDGKNKRPADKTNRKEAESPMENGGNSQKQWMVKKEDSAKSRDSGVSLMSRRSSKYGGGQKDMVGNEEEVGRGGVCADVGADSDQESGYNSPRSSRDHPETSGQHLYDLDPVVKVTRKSLSPPKNHFVVSSAFGAKMNRGDPNANFLPEYPLQRRESPRPAVIPSQVNHHSGHRQQQNYIRRANINEYPPQRTPSPSEEQAYMNHNYQRDAYHHPHHQSSYPAHDLDQHGPDCQLHTSSLPTHREEADHHVDQGGVINRYGCDQDSGFGDREQDDQLSHNQRHPEQQGHQAEYCSKHRARPCLACEHIPPKVKGPAPPQAYKAAFKAGAVPNKVTDDLNQIMKRRHGYKAPKPPPLTSHARFIRGTLAPPLSLGSRTDPIVQYPDFKRLDSTYRLSYGSHLQQQPQHHRQRTKTLTALLNEKSSRVWRS